MFVSIGKAPKKEKTKLSAEAKKGEVYAQKIDNINIFKNVAHFKCTVSSTEKLPKEKSKLPAGAKIGKSDIS